MKKSTQITELPIINISDGSQLGKVKSLVINPDKGSVDFLTIEHDDWQVSVKAIPFKKVVGIGEYAVTIEAESAVIDLNEIPVANQLVNKKIKITNTKVMTRKGELLGEVQEYFIDQETGHILGMLLKVANHQVVLSADMVVTFGKDIIIVKEDASSYYLDSVEMLENNTASDSTVEEIDVANQDLQELKSKQIELLKGKTLVRDVLDQNGHILFPKGMILTAPDIIKAQQEGPEVLVELSMNVEE
ncbi:PRC-barrel domain-containing protein [Bacillus sp. BRMEA1]|uniref:PRC-barrel domain-containing protein n=1 Tax=Neobacillus endophyticus TaxID=2738405 RepID=UPI0015670805|nr:PRC-barrel domain-containing protein [Neobacillus endophyticus]NRD76007.1 PRC-barrel domain-containing protein [Neobacillus endophyticus]